MRRKRSKVRWKLVESEGPVELYFATGREMMAYYSVRLHGVTLLVFVSEELPQARALFDALVRVEKKKAREQKGCSL